MLHNEASQGLCSFTWFAIVMDFFSATSDKMINTIKKDLFDVAAGAPIVGHDHQAIITLSCKR